MSKDTLKGAVVGAITASIVLAASAATAGSVVGGVFNLGRSNAVNATSKLTGRTSKAELRVDNTGNGPALALRASSGHAPLNVNNSVMVPNLNANFVGGKSASSFVDKCDQGSIAAVAAFYAPAVPNDPAYVTPTRFGGEGGFACNGSQPELTREGTGYFRFRIATALPSSHEYILFANPDARGVTPIYADANSALGPVWDIHVFDKTGTPVDPYYLDLQLVAD